MPVSAGRDPDTDRYLTARTAYRDGDVELDEYNAMLANLAERDTHPPA